MALIDIEKKHPFLKEVELKELKNKNKDDVVLKTIKFNSDEHILLKYITYLGKNFGSYIKQLIEKDIEENLEHKSNANISEEYLVELIEKVLNKRNDKSDEAITIIEKENDNFDKELINDLGALGIKKR